MRFSVLENVRNVRVHFLAVSFKLCVNQADSAKRHNRTLKRLVSLKSDNFFFILINIACVVRINR